MFCPNCKQELHKINLADAEVWHCPNCLGFLVEHSQLEKSHQKSSFSWLDVELWENPEKLKIFTSNRLCPQDALPMYSVEYESVTLDICLVHRNIWFDKGEISKIKDILISQISDKTFADFMRKSVQELGKVFTTKEPSEELKHFWIVLDLASHRIAARFPLIGQLISQLP